MHHLERSKCGPLSIDALMPLSDDVRDQRLHDAKRVQTQNVRAGRQYRFADKAVVQLHGPKLECAAQLSRAARAAAPSLDQDAGRVTG
eukprot:11896266-Alexandrium_andersonii.AAC.1